MIYRTLGLLGVLVLALAVAACGPTTAPSGPGATVTPGALAPTDTASPLAPTASPGAGSSEGGALGYAELLEALRDAGAQVEEGPQGEGDIFSVGSRSVRVDGQSLQIYEFEDEAAREAASDAITANGYIIGTMAIDWVEQPNFWADGRVIVLYVGRDQATIERLSAVVGEPLTGPGRWEVVDVESLIGALQDAGAEVERAEQIDESVFQVPIQVIRVNGADVHVFEFADEATRRQWSAQISPDGSEIGTTMITWVDQPHFWAAGRIIVQYVGQDQDTIDLLSIVLGERIASGPPPMQGGEPQGLASTDELVDALENEGAEVMVGDRLEEETFPGVAGTIVTVNGVDLQVFEFPDEDSRDVAAGLISGNGYIIGSAIYEWIGQPNFFASGRLIVLYLGDDQAMIDLLTGILGEPLTGAQTGGPGEFPEAMQAALNTLSQASGAAASEIEVVTFEQVDWTDSCLGLGQPNESCLQAITPGWLIVLRVDGTEYEFHTDLTGEQIRQK